jgi:plasmid maintenance system antidote protein VapI
MPSDIALMKIVEARTMLSRVLRSPFVPDVGLQGQQWLRLQQSRELQRKAGEKNNYLHVLNFDGERKNNFH